MTTLIRHPRWCVTPADEHRDEAHSSRPVPLNPSGDEQVALAVSLVQGWPPFAYQWIKLEITEDGQTSECLITLGQAAALARSLSVLLRTAAHT